MGWVSPRVLLSWIETIQDVNKPLIYALEGDSRFKFSQFETIAL